MILLRRRTLLALPACGLACALLAACGDAPTAPTSFVQEAGGAVWVAVAEPAGLPDADTWLAGVGEAQAGSVRRLHDEALAARRAGNLETWRELEEKAALTAAQAVVTAPPRAKLDGAARALEQWAGRADARLATGAYPELQAAVARVRSLRDLAVAALDAGDTARAVVLLTQSAGQAREFGPMAVATRLLGTAERRIDADPSPTPDLKRARLLLRTAREALATGDRTRAMKRAWYALQLIDAHDARH